MPTIVADVFATILMAKHPSTYLTGAWTGKCKRPLNMGENKE